MQNESALLADQQDKQSFKAVTSLQEFFQTGYQRGWLFEHKDYECSDLVERWGWMHRPSGIFVWGDAIDLSHGSEPRVFFHFTNEPRL